MSERGVFAVDRGIFDHPIFAPEPFTEREAWLWMLSAAAWADKRVRVGKAMIDLKRGQLAFATRFLAEKWKWAHTRVVRFLNRLKTDTMVTTLATREATLITICNYNEYQFGGNATETQNETPTETEVVRERNKEEETNNIITKISRAPALVFESDWPKEFREAFWQLFPKRTNKQAALRKLEQVRRGGKVPWEILIGGVGRYAASVRGKDQQYTKAPDAWLNAGKWDDEIASNSMALPGGQRLEGWV